MLLTVSRKAFGFLAFGAFGIAAAANGLAHSATPPDGAADLATVAFLAALCLLVTWTGFLFGRDYSGEDARRETRRARRAGRRAVAAILAEIEAEEAAEMSPAPLSSAAVTAMGERAIAAAIGLTEESLNAVWQGRRASSSAPVSCYGVAVPRAFRS